MQTRLDRAPGQRPFATIYIPPLGSTQPCTVIRARTLGGRSVRHPKPTSQETAKKLTGIKNPITAK